MTTPKIQTTKSGGTPNHVHPLTEASPRRLKKGFSIFWQDWTACPATATTDLRPRRLRPLHRTPIPVMVSTRRRFPKPKAPMP